MIMGIEKAEFFVAGCTVKEKGLFRERGRQISPFPYTVRKGRAVPQEDFIAKGIHQFRQLNGAKPSFCEETGFGICACAEDSRKHLNRRYITGCCPAGHPMNLPAVEP